LKSCSRQGGAALIVALMVVSLVAMLAITLGNDFLVASKRVQNQIYSQQAYTYLYGAEGYARKWLLDDIAAGNNPSDSEFDVWNTELQVPTEQGFLSGQLSDLQGRFNLNTLAQSAPAASGGAQDPYTESQKRFIRLLQTLELERPLDESSAVEITNAVSDWLDKDDTERSPGGAEGLFYNDTEPYSRVANRSILRVSELRMVKGVSSELLLALAPHVTVWPEGGGSDININTASLNVLQSLNAKGDLEPLNKTDAQYIIEQRETEAFEDPSVLDEGPLKGFNIVTSGLGYTSDYFLLSMETVFLDQVFRLYSVLYRNSDDKTIKVIARTKRDIFQAERCCGPEEEEEPAINE